MPPDAPFARDLARRLAAREPVPNNAPDPAVAAMHGACERVYEKVVRWVGDTGCAALFERAHRSARTAHPALADIRIRPGTQPHIDGVPEASRTEGTDPTVAGLEALLRTVLELLGRFIGEDMVENLVDRDAGGSERKDPK